MPMNTPMAGAPSLQRSCAAGQPRLAATKEAHVKNMVAFGQADLPSRFIMHGNMKRSTLLKKLNAGDFDGAASQFKRWVYAGDQNGDGTVDYEDRVTGLVKRRNREEALFRSGDYGT